MRQDNPPVISLVLGVKFATGITRGVMSTCPRHVTGQLCIQPAITGSGIAKCTTSGLRVLFISNGSGLSCKTDLISGDTFRISGFPCHGALPPNDER